MAHIQTSSLKVDPILSKAAPANDGLALLSRF